MRRVQLLVLAVALAIACARSVVPPSKPLVNVAARPTTAEQVLAAVRERAGRTTGVSAEIEQDVFNAMFGTRKHTHGTLVFAKPDRFRIDYDNRKSFVSNGSDLWILEPDQLLAMHAKADASTSPAVFAPWRGDDLAATHRVAFATAASPHAPAPVAGRVVLELVPRAPSDRVARLYFVVDTATTAVVMSVVVESSGNTNTFTFSQVRLDATPAASTFEVDPSSIPSNFKIVTAP